MVANAQEFEQDGICYQVNSDNSTVTVVQSFFGYSGDIVIPESVNYQGNDFNVVSIEKSAFMECTGITSITIGNNVTSIGDKAFYKCTGLTSIIIPNSIAIIGNAAFNGCTGLRNITIPNSVTSIGEAMFEGCSELENITLGNCITYIDKKAFSGCTHLKEIILPNSLTSIGEKAFERCTGLTKIILPSNVSKVGLFAFRYCNSLKTFINLSNLRIDVPHNAKSIDFPNGDIVGDYIFAVKSGKPTLCAYIGNETKIELPQEYKEGNYAIAPGAFNGVASIESITIPNSISIIGNGAFTGCRNLKEIINFSTIPVNSSTAAYVVNAPNGYIEGNFIVAEINGVKTRCGYIGANSFSVDGIYYNVQQDDKTTVAVTTSPNGYSGNIIIPESVNFQDAEFKVVAIEDQAFIECTKLTSITIGNNVTSIGNGAFYDCTNLNYIIIPNTVTRIGLGAFSGCEHIKTYVNLSDAPIFPDVMLNGARVVKIPNGNIEGDYIFAEVDGKQTLCAYIGKKRNIELPQECKNGSYAIASGAFKGANSITRITIPNSISIIAEGAFDGCSNLKNVINLSTTRVASSAATNVINAPNGYIEDGYIFANIDGKATLCAYIGNAKKLELPQECKSGSYAIAPAAFKGAASLQSVTIPSSITDIDNYAFLGCNNLKEIINFSATPVNSSAYVIYAPNGYIEDSYVFAEINGTTTLCGYIGNKKMIDLPQECKNSSYAIAAYAFAGNSSIQCITIPNSVTSIGKDAFTGCSKLKNIINFSTTPIDNSAVAGVVNAPNGHIEGDYIFAEIDSTATLCGYVGNKTRIELPQECKNGCYAIASGAFKGAESIQHITIPNSIAAIDSNAFAGCSRLTEIINFSTTTVDKSAASYVVNAPNGQIEKSYIFADINGTATLCGYVGNETKIELPQEYKSGKYDIASGAFKGKSFIQYITIPSCVTVIGSDAFAGCRGLKEVINFSATPLDKSIASFVANAPNGYIEDATIFADINGVKTQCGYIGENAFNVDGIYYNVLQNDRSTVKVVRNPNKYSGNIVIPESVNYRGTDFKVVSIGEWAFSECESFTGITIPNSVTSIGNGAFDETYALKSIIIPSSVTSVGNNLFGSFGIKKIINLSKIAISYHNSSSLTHAPNGYIEGAMVYADVNGVKTLFGCIVEGFSVDNIYYSVCDEDYSNVAVYKHPDDRKYSGDIVIPESVNYLGSNFKVVAVGGFSGDDITSVKIPNSVTSIYDDAFARCYNLASVTIGNGVKSIGDYAFNSCDELKSIKIPNSVTSIGASAFEDCDRLTKVTMGSGVKTIGEDAFEDCDTITNVYISNLAAWCKIEFSDSLSNPLNAGAKLFVNNAQLTSFVTPKGITKINNFAFFGCKGLTSVNISSSVKTVGERAFKNCANLKTITLSNKIDELGEEVFFGCEKLTSVTIKRTISNGFIKSKYNAFSEITYNRATLYVHPSDYRLYYYDLDWGWGPFRKVVKRQ